MKQERNDTLPKSQPQLRPTFPSSTHHHFSRSMGSV